MKADPENLTGSPTLAGTIRLLVSLILLSIFLTNCSEEKPFRETMFLMGTLVEIVAYPDSQQVRDAVSMAFRRMEKVEALADYKASESPLTSLRRGEDAALSDELLQILSVAIEVARMSRGAFDPTMGELVALWGFDRSEPKVPGSVRISEALGSVGYKRLSVDGVSVKVSGEKVWLELGGVAKGYAVDEAVRILKKGGVSAGIINAGGDLRAFGEKPDGKQWRIGVQNPDDPQGMLGVLILKEGSVATSGDYERYFELDGVRYHHILDPKTGLPSRSGIRSVTVVTSECVLADALATAAFVLGPDQGQELLGKHNGVEAILVIDNGQILKTSGIGTVVEFEER
ncbi:FAD:protein FMN transferase [bacterium]|nr:MAG: FAD:protein FMN transferase [bacterium]